MVTFPAYTSRILHMLSMGLIMGDAISAFLIGDRSDALAKVKPALLYSICGILTIGTGLFNWRLFAPKKTMNGGDAKMYTGMVHSKLLLVCLVFTPLGKKVFSSDVLVVVKCCTAVCLVLMAAFMRFFREDAMKRKRD